MVDIDWFYISQVKKEAKLYKVLLQLKKERLKRCWISRIQKNNPWLRCAKAVKGYSFFNILLNNSLCIIYKYML